MKSKIFLLIFSVLFLIGCAGKNFKMSDAKTVKKGDTSEALVKKMKGRPYNITTKQLDGEHVEMYIYVYVAFDGSRKSVSFILKNDKVIEIPYIPKSLIEE